MLCEFEKKVLSFIKEQHLFDKGGKVLLAVSGGADSIALLHMLWALKAACYIDVELICAHLNHQLRGGEADGDENFVAFQAGQLQIKFVHKSLDVKAYAQRNKLSIETAARQWRIETLGEIARQNGCEWIATGHQKDDNAETIIQRLLRGTGFRGLGGIGPKLRFDSGAGFVRPLLCVNRNEITEYLKRRRLTWRQDATNIQIQFKRNFIRHRLMPELQSRCSDSLSQQLWELASKARKLNTQSEEHVNKLWQQLAEASEEKVVFMLDGFLAQPEPMQVGLVRQSLVWLGSGEKKLKELHYNSVLELAQQNVSNRILELPDGFRAWREYKRLVLAAGKDDKRKKKPSRKAVEIKIPGKTHFGDYLIEAMVENAEPGKLKEIKQNKVPSVERFDFDKLKPPLSVRFRQSGDRFIPLGMESEKKIGQFLTDARIPYDIRSKVLVVSDTEKIIWLAPVRISEQAKVTGHTKQAVQLRIAKRH